MSTPVETGSRVRCERDGGILRLVLDRPPLNVADVAMLEALDAALRSEAASPDTRVVVLAGAGRAFCAGADVADHVPARAPQMIRVFGRVIRGLLDLEVPSVAAVHGAALGGGCELAMACDLVWAREDARLGQPEVRVGAFPPAAAALLPRLVGPQAALDLVLTGRTIGAEEALRMGLVSRVLPVDSFEAEVRSMAAELAGLSRPVLGVARRAVREAIGRPPGTALDRAESLYLEDLLPLRDAAEGVAAFMEKREPAWRDA
ncbi:MAG: enoyl-CoA hydratase-related protein [Candidatus Palauibacterales bacterium]|nr:enoyl-CoA hydratase-related protein [Candidatus Palauibacterales bacterium]MDP2528521.1 enoyl-CoA hydratase-related protein [Candidatus Palauibacterales bacterium]MDP2583695.1 enoyl-CoA hydratase-related protein [Candidatus Palauibacterales bacterium]